MARGLLAWLVLLACLSARVVAELKVGERGADHGHGHDDADDEEDGPEGEEDEEAEGEGETDEEDHGGLSSLEGPLPEGLLRHLHRILDDNKDGRVYPEEALAVNLRIRKEVARKDTQQVLANHDKDGNGKLSLDEVLAEMRELKDEPGGADEDVKTHRLAIDEEIAHNEAKFHAADEDGDGELSGDELISYYHEDGSERVQEVVSGRTMKGIDKNKDGQLSLEEFLGDPSEAPYEPGYEDVHPADLKQFREMDKDGDGLLTLAEYGPWHTVSYHTQKNIEDLFDTCDRGKKGYLTSADLVKARKDIHAVEAQHHIAELLDMHEANDGEVKDHEEL